MKIIIAPDSFKGSMTSVEAAEQMKQGILAVDPMLDISMIPVADGGEGTVDAITIALQGEKVVKQVNDPIGRLIDAEFGWIPKSKTAVVETAAASGLPLLTEKELDPVNASTYGTGELVKEALEKGAERIILGLGGSATVDAGTGFLEALGVRFLDDNGKEIRASGGTLSQIASIDSTKLDKRLENVEFMVASDVTNPLLGEKGAVAVFGPQKGVKNDQLNHFERGMARYAQQVIRHIGKDFTEEEGSGAAGGFGFSLLSFLEPSFESGFEMMARLSDLEDEIRSASFVITGEGKLDTQSLYGKVPIGIARLAKRNHIPAIAFTGKIEGDLTLVKDEGLELVLPIVDGAMSLDDALNNGKELLYRASRRFIETIHFTKSIREER
ncbi:glycerate kinase [Thalassobacillus devorans]|uniref:glycerate kinase n=1 Tax=Thalassobacillus devorans TaxID=279813 RepID=UPI0020CAA4AC|nr:glycerate kinase [Thalassobacillus devorans]